HNAVTMRNSTLRFIPGPLFSGLRSWVPQPEACRRSSLLGCGAAAIPISEGSAETQLPARAFDRQSTRELRRWAHVENRPLLAISVAVQPDPRGFSRAERDLEPVERHQQPVAHRLHVRFFSRPAVEEGPCAKLTRQTDPLLDLF